MFQNFVEALISLVKTGKNTDMKVVHRVLIGSLICFILIFFKMFLFMLASVAGILLFGLWLAFLTAIIGALGWIYQKVTK